MAELKEGDTVKHKTGGPMMVIKEIRSDSEIICEWSDDKGHIKERICAGAVLKLWDDTPAMPQVISSPRRGWNR